MKMIKLILAKAAFFLLFSCESKRIQYARAIKVGDSINSVNHKMGMPHYSKSQLYQGDTVIHLRYELGWGAPDDINIYMSRKDSIVLKVFSESM